MKTIIDAAHNTHVLLRESPVLRAHLRLALWLAIVAASIWMSTPPCGCQ